MRTLRESTAGQQVIVLQKLLSHFDSTMVVSGSFDRHTFNRVKDFQRSSDLPADGIVGDKTWRQLLKKCYSFNLEAHNHFLDVSEYMEDIYMKRSIYLHHTAGRYRPDFTIQGWNLDAPPGKLNRVGTAFVIGGKGFDGDTTYDGKLFRAFNEIYWAHHLGLKVGNNDRLNQESIGIEICSLGALIKTQDGRYRAAAYPDRPIYVPDDQVYALETPWRGYQYFQPYTERQIRECKRLILTLAILFDIQLRNITYDVSWFKIKDEALSGIPGLWTHAHVRLDKSDCFPQVDFIAMLNSLHDAQKTFVLTSDSFEGFIDNPVHEEENMMKQESDEGILGYSTDLSDIN